MEIQEINKENIAPLFPKRAKDTHKGSYGVCAVVGGSQQYTGAAYLSSYAALKGGAGYVCLYAPSKILPYFALKSPELILRNVANGNNIRLNKKKISPVLTADCIAFGMGAGRGKGTLKTLRYILENYTGKLLVDADGLNALSTLTDERKYKLFREKKCQVLCTPHLKEFERISGVPLFEIQKNPVEQARNFARKYGVILALKSSRTIVTDGEKTAVFTGGTPAQAKGGSGDVLSGLIASIAATGLSLFDAARSGVYLSGKAAEIAVQKTGEFSLTATDTADHIARAFLSLL